MGFARQRSSSMLQLLCFVFAVLVPCPAVMAQQTQTQPPVTILTRVIPEFNGGKPYRVQLQASGGTAPYTWRLVQGTLPDGVGLTTTGLLVGRPRGPSSSAIVVEVVDSSTPPKAVQQQYDFSGALTIEWRSGPSVQNGGISGQVTVGNHTGDTFDITVIILAVDEQGRATALGYQHFNLAARVTGQLIPFGTTLPPGKYVIHADAIAEVATRNSIYHARQQTPAALEIASSP